MLSEVSSTKYTTTSANSKTHKYNQPRFTLVQEPPEGTPQYLVFEIELPEQVDNRYITKSFQKINSYCKNCYYNLITASRFFEKRIYF